MSDALIKDCPLNKTELCVLDYLSDSDYWVHPFNTIGAVLNLNRTQVKRAVRSLARNGYAELTAAYDENDGRLKGSGYIVTRDGKARRDREIAA